MTTSPPSTGRAVFLFGETRVHVDGESVRLSPNELALVATVFAAGSIGRPEIVRLLWDEPETTRTRHRVRQLLHRLASKVGSGLVGADEDQLVRGVDVWSDASEVETAIESRRLWDAGKFLERGAVRLAYHRLPDGLEDWFELHVQGMRKELKHLAEGAWAEGLQKEDWPAARDAAEASYCLEPDATDPVLRVIESRARVGKVAASEAAYSRYCDSGPADDDPVHELMERVRKLDQAPTRPSMPVAPFVGRKQELTVGRGALERVAGGGFEFLLITGEAGIGKTRFMEELRKDALLKDFRCLSAKSVELEQIIPLNPLLDALKDVDVAAHLEKLGPPWDAVVSTALPTFAPEDVGELPPIQESSLTRRLLDAMSMLLESIAAEGPTILFLDDLHWADATTVTALQFFQRRWSEGQFGVVATARPNEAKKNEAVSTYLTDREDLPVTHVELGELSDEEAAELVAGVLGSASDDRVDQLCQLGGPHPLFLVELSRDALLGGVDLPEAPHGHVPIPLSLRQMLDAKSSDLPESARRIARVLAVMGRPVSLQDLVALAGVSLDECIEAADFLEERGLVQADGRKLVMAHDLFRSAIYAAIGSARLIALHQQVAAHLEVSEEVIPEFELATHFLLGGDAARGAELAAVCGQKAWDSGAMAEAARYYELASTHEPDEGRAAGATARWARALHLKGDLDGASAALDLASSRLRRVGEASHARRLQLYLAQVIGDTGAVRLEQIITRLAIIREEAEREDDWHAIALARDMELRIRRMFLNETADADLIASLREIVGSGPRAAQTVAHGALALALTQIDPTGALHHATSAIELSESVAGGERLNALNRGLIVLYHQGRLALPVSRPWIDEARSIARRSGNVQVQFSIENNLGAGAMDAADYDRADVLLQRAGSFLHPSNPGRLWSLNQANRGELALARGEYDTAQAIYRAIVSAVDQSTPWAIRDVAFAGLGICALEFGQLTEARKCNDELETEVERSIFDPTIVLLFRARLLDRQGRWKEGADLLREGAERARGRMVLSWLKLVQHHAHLVARRSRCDVSEILQDALSTAAALSLTHREQELRQVRELGRAY